MKNNDLYEIQKRRLREATDQNETDLSKMLEVKFSESDMRLICSSIWDIAKSYEGNKTKHQVINEVVNGFR